MTKRIELLPNGFIQFRDIKEVQYHRSVIAPDGDYSSLPNKCDVAFMSEGKILEDIEVKPLIKKWRETVEIKKAIEDYKNRSTDI